MNIALSCSLAPKSDSLATANHASSAPSKANLKDVNMDFFNEPDSYEVMNCLFDESFRGPSKSHEAIGLSKNVVCLSGAGSLGYSASKESTFKDLQIACSSKSIEDTDSISSSHEEDPYEFLTTLFDESLKMKVYFSKASGYKDRPIFKLSVGLINTYRHVNKVYFERKSAQILASEHVQMSFAAQSCLSMRQYPMHEGLNRQTLTGPLGVISLNKKLGMGSFGEVYEGTFLPSNSQNMLNVAIKVSRRFSEDSENRIVFESLQKEIQLLKRLTALDPEDSQPLTRFSNSFMLQSKQICLMQPLYSGSLHYLCSRTEGHGVSFRIVNKIAHQLFEALRFFKRPDIDIVHFDLKPDNILLESDKKTKIRIIDFGSARSSKECIGCKDYLVTRYYRAPEILLELPYTHAVDIWSVACILFEIHTARILFPANSSLELLTMMVDLLGPIPEEVVKQVSAWQQKFVQAPQKPGFYIPLISKTTYSSHENRRVYFDKKLSQSYRESTLASNSFMRSCISQDLYDRFKDLLLSMLRWNPKDRISVEDLFTHPFVVAMDELVKNEKLVDPKMSSQASSSATLKLDFSKIRGVNSSRHIEKEE
jgi:dual specificity tyrosine-phosphorylation-regulated kinase 1